MSFAIDNTLIYFSHIVSGGNVFHSRKEMEEYENILSLGGSKTISKTIFNLYTRALFNRIPTRGTINAIRDILDTFRESLDCREPLPERRPYSVGDQDMSALGRYDGVLAGDLQKELNKLAESVRIMLQELNQQKLE